MTTELVNKEVKGITIRQIVSYTVAVAGFCFFYFSIRENIRENREVMLQVQRQFDEQKRINDIRITSIEQNQRSTDQNQRTTDIRLTVIETTMKK